MLKLLRNKNVSKVIFWALVILILPAFVLWGTGSLGRGGGKGPKYVGVIGNKKVTFDEFADNITSVRTQILLNYFNQPKLLDTYLKNKELLGRLAWDRILMCREAKKLKIPVSDKEVISAIKTHPMFLRGGSFDDRLYAYVLKNNFGLYPRNFEEVMRENLAIKKLNDIISGEVKLSDEETLEDYRKKNEMYKLAYVVIPTTNFMDKTKISDAEIKDYYEKHKTELLIPVKDPQTNKMTLKTAELKDVYDNLSSRLAQEKARPSAMKYAEEVRAEIMDMTEKGNLSFEDAVSKLGLALEQTDFLARTGYAEGIGEASVLVDEAMRLKDGGISAVVETRKGPVIFKVLEKAKYDEEKFKNEKDEHKKKLLEEMKNKRLEEWIRGMEHKAVLNIDVTDYEKYYK
jgi:peptidyl-prolyl cis-trans isomerase D